MAKAKRSAGKLAHISPDKIGRNPDNPRLIFRQEEMESLLVSVNTHGIQVPLTVYREGDSYCLIDGERRWRCARSLNLKTVPALVQDKPTELENLLLMYNIHALREQWDYFTIATKLTRVKELYLKDHGYEPNEILLSEETGLTRGQIRRCQLLLDLPEEFKSMLFEELSLPKSQQKFSEDFFIEMERSLKTVVKRFPEFKYRLGDIRHALVSKYRDGTIEAVTDFRQLSKIATAIDNLGVPAEEAETSLSRIFDLDDPTSIRNAYEQSVEFGYDERKASLSIRSLTEFIDQIIRMRRETKLDDEFVVEVRKLYLRLKKLLGE